MAQYQTLLVGSVGENHALTHRRLLAAFSDYQLQDTRAAAVYLASGQEHRSMAYAMWMSGSMDALSEDAYLRIVVQQAKKGMRYNCAVRNHRVSRRAVHLIRCHLLDMRLSVVKQMEVRRTYQWGAVQISVIEETVVGSRV